MTLTECIENHKKLWNWIADKSIERERQVVKWEYFAEKRKEALGTVRNHCYLCEYVTQNGLDCSKCPIKTTVGDQGKVLECCDGLYAEWYYTVDYKRCSDLARQIANCSLEDWAIEKLREEKENGRS